MVVDDSGWTWKYPDTNTNTKRGDANGPGAPTTLADIENLLGAQITDMTLPAFFTSPRFEDFSSRGYLLQDQADMGWSDNQMEEPYGNGTSWTKGDVLDAIQEKRVRDVS